MTGVQTCALPICSCRPRSGISTKRAHYTVACSATHPTTASGTTRDDVPTCSRCGTDATHSYLKARDAEDAVGFANRARSLTSVVRCRVYHGRPHGVWQRNLPALLHSQETVHPIYTGFTAHRRCTGCCMVLYTGCRPNASFEDFGKMGVIAT